MNFSLQINKTNEISKHSYHENTPTFQDNMFMLQYLILMHLKNFFW